MPASERQMVGAPSSAVTPSPRRLPLSLKGGQLTMCLGERPQWRM